MATGKTSNVVSLKPGTTAGGILKGTLTSVIPTDATTPLDETFNPLGYVTDKGVSLKPNKSITEKKAWGGYVIKTMASDTSAELSFALAELFSVETLKAAYGEENVVVTPANAEHGERIALRYTNGLPEIAPYVVESKDGKKRVRVVIPRLQVTDQGDFVFDDNATTDTDIKGKAFPDENGVLFYIYTDDGEKAA